MLRPLSQVEIIPMPYVTEATKVNIILPVTVHEAEALSKFLAVYEKVLFKFHPCHPSDGLFFRIAWQQKKMFYLPLFLFMVLKMLEKFIKRMTHSQNRKIDWTIWRLNMEEENRNQK